MARWLTHAGRLVLTKVTLTSLAIYPAIAIQLSPWAIRAIDKLRRAFLWKGTAAVSGGHCLVAWSTACRPVAFGGLGIIDLRSMGLALQMRWLWLSRVEPDRPGAGLTVPTNNTLLAMFNASVAVEVNDGRSVLFWRDKWLDGQSLEQIAPNLLATVPACVRNSRTVRDALEGRRWVRDIKAGLTAQVILEYLRVWDLLDGRVLSDRPDSFRWKWTSSGQYSASSAYRAFFLGLTEQLGAKQLWKIKAPNKCRFFLWLLLHGRCCLLDVRSTSTAWLAQSW